MTQKVEAGELADLLLHRLERRQERSRRRARRRRWELLMRAGAVAGIVSLAWQLLELLAVGG